MAIVRSETVQSLASNLIGEVKAALTDSKTIPINFIGAAGRAKMSWALAKSLKLAAFFESSLRSSSDSASLKIG